MNGKGLKFASHFIALMLPTLLGAGPATDRADLVEMLISKNEASARQARTYVLDIKLDGQSPDGNKYGYAAKQTWSADGRLAMDVTTQMRHADASGKALGIFPHHIRVVVDHTQGTVAELVPNPQAITFDYERMDSMPQSIHQQLMGDYSTRYERFGFTAYGDELRPFIEAFIKRDAKVTVEERKNKSGEAVYLLSITPRSFKSPGVEMEFHPQHGFLIERYASPQNGLPGAEVTITPAQITTADGKNVWLPVVVEEKVHRRFDHQSGNSLKDEQISRGWTARITYESVNANIDDSAFSFDALNLPDGTCVGGKSRGGFVHHGKVISNAEARQFGYPQAYMQRLVAQSEAMRQPSSRPTTQPATQPQFAPMKAVVEHPTFLRRNWIWLTTGVGAVAIVALMLRNYFGKTVS